MHDYGPMNMVEKLTERDLIYFPEYRYRDVFHLNGSEKLQSLLLHHYMFESFNNFKYQKIEQFLNNDSRLWHLSLRMTSQG